MATVEVNKDSINFRNDRTIIGRDEVDVKYHSKKNQGRLFHHSERQSLSSSGSISSTAQKPIILAQGNHIGAKRHQKNSGRFHFFYGGRYGPSHQPGTYGTDCNPSDLFNTNDVGNENNANRIRNRTHRSSLISIASECSGLSLKSGKFVSYCVLTSEDDSDNQDIGDDVGGIVQYNYPTETSGRTPEKNVDNSQSLDILKRNSAVEGLTSHMSIPSHFSSLTHHSSTDNKPPVQDELLFMIRLAEKLKRHDDVQLYFDRIFQLKLDGEDLPNRIKHALQCLKDSISDRRNEYKLLSVIIENEQKKSNCANSQNVALCKLYKRKLAHESTQLCEKYLKLFREKLLPSASDARSKIIYLKLEADYYRYLSEFTDLLYEARNKEKADKIYAEATRIAKSTLPAYDAIRLSLALNWAVFYYEIIDNKKKALEIVKVAFNEALDILDNVSDVDYKETAIVLQVMRDNINIWRQSIYGKNSIFIL